MLLGVGGHRIEGKQRERVHEMVGGLDGRGHGGAEHGLCPRRPLERLDMAPVEEGEDLLHDVVEGHPATERRLRDAGDASRLIETAVVHPWRLATNCCSRRMVW